MANATGVATLASDPMQWVEDHADGVHLDLSGIDTPEDYLTVAAAIASKKNRLKWWIGDLIIQAKRFGDLYDQIQSLTGYKDSYLHDIEKVSGAFAVSERSPKVLWRCYYDAYRSGLPREDQVYLLCQAAANPEFTSVTAFQLILDEYRKAKGLAGTTKPPTARAIQGDGHDLASIVDAQKKEIAEQERKIEKLSAEVLRQERELDELAGFREPENPAEAPVQAPKVNGDAGTPHISAPDAARIGYGGDSDGHAWIMLTAQDGKALVGIMEHLKETTGRNWTPGGAAGWAFTEVCEANGIDFNACQPLVVAPDTPAVDFFCDTPDAFFDGA